MPEEKDSSTQTNNAQSVEEKNINIKDIEDSKIEITTDIPVADFEKYREKTVKKLGESITISGFRKGHIPENILIQKIGEHNFLQEMAEMAIAQFYIKTITEKKIEAIGRPEVIITKLAKGNPVGVKIITAVLPKFELPDHKAIAKKINDAFPDTLKVTDKELEDAIMDIRRNTSRQGAPTKDGEAPKEIKDEDLPEFTDDFVKQFGDFKTVLDFRIKIRENMQKEKQIKEHEKRRMKIMEGIQEKITVVIPQILIESEQEKMFAQMKASIEGMGLTLKKYLEQIKKTEEDIKKESAPEAKKKVIIQLILSKIAVQEKLSVPEDELKKEVDHLLQHHKDADPQRARNYIDGILLNEKVFQLLESQGEKDDTLSDDEMVNN